MTRLLAVLLDASDVFLMTFMILQDSYMEPTRVGSDSGGDIIARHNKLRDCFANLCSKACLSPQLEKGPGLDFSRPADVLVPNWSLSNPAAFDLKVIHLLNTDLVLEATRQLCRGW